MSVEDGEEGALRPSFTFLLWGLLDIEDYGDAVFVIVSYDSLVGVGSVCLDDAIFLDRILRLFKVW